MNNLLEEYSNQWNNGRHADEWRDKDRMMISFIQSPFIGRDTFPSRIEDLDSGFLSMNSWLEYSNLLLFIIKIEESSICDWKDRLKRITIIRWYPIFYCWLLFYFWSMLHPSWWFILSFNSIFPGKWILLFETYQNRILVC
jgi:hypothetical protein